MRGRQVRRSRQATGAVGGGRADRILKELTSYHDELASQCAALKEEMDAMAGAIQTLRRGKGGAPRSASRPAGAARRSGAVRGPRGTGQSLKDYIAGVLGSSGSAMRLMDVAKAVVSAGYPTKSKNLLNQVNMAIADMKRKKLVRKVGRGLYEIN